jgi:hypothetical protein
MILWYLSISRLPTGGSEGVLNFGGLMLGKEGLGIFGGLKLGKGGGEIFGGLKLGKEGVLNIGGDQPPPPPPNKSAWAFSPHRNTIDVAIKVAIFNEARTVMPSNTATKEGWNTTEELTCSDYGQSKALSSVIVLTRSGNSSLT